MLGGRHWVQMPTQLSGTIPPLPVISCSMCRVWVPWLEPGGACSRVSHPVVSSLVLGDTLRLDYLPHRPRTPAVLAVEARRPSCHHPPGPFLTTAALSFLTTSLRHDSQLTQFTTDPVQVKALGSSEFSNLQHNQFWNIFLPSQRNPAPLIITP